MRISLNGFTASFTIGGNPVHIKAIVTDTVAQTVECYIKAWESESFGVSWKCHKSLPPSQGDVWIDGMWVGSRRFDASQYTGDNDIIQAELQHTLPSQGEAVGDKFIFNMEAIQEAEKTDDGGVHLINTILGLDDSSTELEASSMGQSAENSTGHGGPGELCLVITRADPLSLPETDGSTGQTAHIATFTFKYRTKAFLSKKGIEHRPPIEKHLVTNGEVSNASERTETTHLLDPKAPKKPHVRSKSRGRKPKTYKTLGEMKIRLGDYIERTKKLAREVALKEELQAMARSMRKRVSEQGRAPTTAVNTNSHGLHDVDIGQVDMSGEAYSSTNQKKGGRARRFAARRQRYKDARIELQRRKEMERQSALGAASNTDLSVLDVKEQIMDVEREEVGDDAIMQY